MSKLVQIVQGKPGTPTETHRYITNRDHEVAARALIEATGAVNKGGKNGISLWMLPDTMSTEAVEDLRLAAEATLAQSVPAEAPVPEDVPATPDRARAPVLSASSEVDLGNGYRAGMSNAQRDMCRWPVRPGSVKPGDVLEVNGVRREIVMIGATVHAASDTLKDLKHRFPGVAVVEGGDHAFQFAMWRPDPEVFLIPVRAEQLEVPAEAEPEPAL